MFNFLLPQSSVKLDIVIPIIEKDLPTLPYVIKGIRSQLMHPLGTIYLIAPESLKIREAAEKYNATFILEDTVLPKFRQNPPQAGWIKQQYLKLNADQFVQSDHYLVVDATLFLCVLKFLNLREKQFLTRISIIQFLVKLWFKEPFN